MANYDLKKKVVLIMMVIALGAVDLLIMYMKFA